jgi:membrane-associated phospholipid phosphatase
MQHLRTFLFGLLLTVVSVAVSYQWLDRPISFFTHVGLAPLRIFTDLTRIPEYMIVVASLIFIIVGLFVLIRRPLTKLPSVLLLCAISIGVASQIKDQLKYMFGRTWPETWINNNPSLIRDGVSGFNFFHGGPGYAAFPSGHTTVTCAAAAVLWISYPRYRPLFAAMVGAVGVGLIGANYHFLSDVIAGAFIGSSSGWIAVLLWDAGGLPRLAPEQTPSRPPA